MKKAVGVLIVIIVALFAGCSTKHVPVQSDGGNRAAQGAGPQSNASGTATELVFPAYQRNDDANNSAVYEAEPFVVTILLPDGWTVRVPQEKDGGVHTFLTPVDIYYGEQPAGFIGYNIFEPYEAADVPAQDYYKTVYPQLRLGSMYRWEDYTPVKTTDTSETALATVSYIKPEEAEKHPGAMPDAPATQVPGMLCYNKALGVFVGVQFNENVVSEEQLGAMAESLAIRAMP